MTIHKNYSLETGISMEPLSQNSLLTDSEIDVDQLLKSLSTTSVDPCSNKFLQPLTTDSFTSLTSNSVQSIGSWQTGIYNTAIGTGTTLTIGTGTGISGLGAHHGNTNSNWQQGIFNFDDENEKRVTKIVRKELKPVMDRLAILEAPSKEVLDAFESLKMAYDHYKMLEALMSTEIEKIKSRT